MLLFPERTWSLIASVLCAYALSWVFSSTHCLYRPFFKIILKANPPWMIFWIFQLDKLSPCFEPHITQFESLSVLYHILPYNKVIHILLLLKLRGWQHRSWKQTKKKKIPHLILATWLCLGKSPSISKPQFSLPVRIRSYTWRVLPRTWFILRTQ